MSTVIEQVTQLKLIDEAHLHTRKHQLVADTLLIMGQVIKDLEIEIQKVNKQKKDIDMVMDLKIVELSRTRKQLEYVVSESVSHEFDKDELE